MKEKINVFPMALNYKTQERKHTKEQDKLRDILQDYDCEEYGDCIIDEICELFNSPLTPEEEPNAKTF